MNAREILNYLDNGPGYVLLKLNNKDYKLIRNLIAKQYKKNLLKFHPELYSNNILKNIQHYHKLNIEDHKSVWQKQSRTLEEMDLIKFKGTDFIKKLEKTFNTIQITNEDGTRSEEVYWRIVRPNKSEDIGPLHADSWFWNLHNGTINNSLRRIKAWISIHNEMGKSGLKVIKNSQKYRYPYKGELREGKMKPIINKELERDQNIEKVLTNSGDCIIFHDDLIHGGFVGGDETRVSIEFTFLIKK